MYAIREARLSVWRTLKDSFEETDNWNPEYTVYGIDDMDSAASSLTRPFIFLLDSRVLFETRHLPVIVIDCEFDTRPFELGTSPWGYCHLTLHIFGRTRGERDDLAGSIIKNITGITMRDFDDDDQPEVETKPLIADDRGRYWTQTHGDISTEVAIEESLANWDSLSTTFHVDMT